MLTLEKTLRITPETCKEPNLTSRFSDVDLGRIAATLRRVASVRTAQDIATTTAGPGSAVGVYADPSSNSALADTISGHIQGQGFNWSAHAVVNGNTIPSYGALYYETYRDGYYGVTVSNATIDFNTHDPLVVFEDATLSAPDSSYLTSQGYTGHYGWREP